MRFNKCAYSCMHLVILTCNLSNAFYGIFVAPPTLACSCTSPLLSILWPTPMPIEPGARTHASPRRVSVFFSATTCCLGHPNGKPLSLVRALRPSIVASQTVLLRHVGCANSCMSFVAHRPVPPLSIVTTSRPPTLHQILSNTSTRNTSRLIYILCVTEWPSATFVFSTYHPARSS